MSKTLAFPTHLMAVLFSAEISGQISDGHWENAVPHNHWKPWCDAEVIVDRDNPGRDFYAGRDKYDLLSPKFLQVCEPRMLVLGRLALQGFDADTCRLLSDSLWSLTPVDPANEDGPWHMVWTGMPTHEGKFWDARRAELEKFDLVQIRCIGEHPAFTSKQLRVGLAKMKAVMRTMRRKEVKTA